MSHRRGIVTAALSLLLISPSFGAEKENGKQKPIAPHISIERTGCYGECPVYKLTLFPNGVVTFEGVANVKKIGAYKSKIEPRKYKYFESELERIKFFSISSDPCGSATDLPYTITSIGTEKNSHIVGRQFNCKETFALNALEAVIEKSVNARQWIER